MRNNNFGSFSLKMLRLSPRRFLSFFLLWTLIVFQMSRPGKSCVCCVDTNSNAICLSLTVSSVKCYICEFNINYCKDPHCYTNPDICSANAFSSVLAPLQECPRNCMLKAVTNPAGIVLKWKRLCAPANDLTHGYQCRIDYIFGARIEQCTCDKDYCNHAQGAKPSHWIGLGSILIFVLQAVYFCFY